MHNREYYLKRIHPIGKVFYYTKAAKFWEDGDGVAIQFNWWHPLGLFAIICFSIAIFLVVGISGWKYEAEHSGILVPKYWKENERKYL